MKASYVILLLVALAVLSTGGANKKLIAEQEQQIDDLQGEIMALEGDLAAERQRTAQLNSELEQALSDMRSKEQVWMEERDGLTHITLDGEVTFASGSARLTSDGKEILDRIWGVIDGYPERTILIEGHTDNVPIAPKWQHRFKSNWELSSARAHAVLHYVRGKYGTTPSRIGAVGYGEHRPIDTNDTAEGRATNRRTVITIGTKASSQKMVP
jgi:chemotaxis protein MotB